MVDQKIEIAPLQDAELEFAEKITLNMFESDMLRFKSTIPFQEAALESGTTGVRWPGEIIVDPAYDENKPALSQRWINEFGADASLHTYVYDLKNPNIIDTLGFPREGLSEALAFASENNLSFTMLVPEERYIVVSNGGYTLDIASVHEDLDIFLERLASGHFGDVPADFSMQIGQEYYTGQLQALVEAGLVSHTERVEAFGQLYNEMVSYIDAKVAALNVAGQNPQDIAPQTFVHMGRYFGNPEREIANPNSGTFEDAFTLSEQFDTAGMTALDGLLVQRYVPGFEGINDGLSEDVFGNQLADIERIWLDAAERVDVEDKVFTIAAGWAMSSTIRQELRQTYDRGVTDTAFRERTNRDFEQYSQDQWDQRHEYGAQHASALLQFFTELAGAGVDKATIYGVDLGQPGQLSAHALNGDVVTFTAGTLFQMMRNSLPGTSVQRAYLDNTREDTNPDGSARVNMNVFESDDKVVAYLWVNDIPSGGVTAEIDFAGIGALDSYFIDADAVLLRSVAMDDWRERFGVEDLDARWGAGFQDPEASTFEVAYTDSDGDLPTWPILFDGNTFTVEFEEDFDLIEVTLNKRADAELDPDYVNENGTLLVGTQLSDEIDGTAGDDVIRGLADPDFIDSRGGEDSVYGGSGNDVIFETEGGRNYLFGGSGDDNISGAGGPDFAAAGTGDDRISGGNGADLLFGNNGSDLVFGNGGDDALNGGAGADRLQGDDGDDILRGDLGNDTLFGGSGEDRLIGDAGNDVIDGGAGRDWLFGGAGRDTFVFNTGDGRDTIEDFDVGQGDRIDLRGFDLDGDFEDYAAQAGNDVVFAFSGADRVTVSDLELSDLDSGSVLL